MSNNIWEIAEAIVSGTISPSEREKVNQRMAADHEFAAELNENLDMLNGLKDSGKQKRFRSMLKDIHAKRPARKARTIQLPAQFWRTASVAATVALLTSFTSYLFFISSANKTRSEYSTISRKVDNLDNDQKKLKIVQDSLISTIQKNTPAPPPSDVRYTGTGFALTNDGYFVTSYHVINYGEFDSIYIKCSDAMYYKAFLVNFNAKADVALLRVEKKGFKFSKSDVPYTIAPAKSGLGAHIFTLGFPKDDVVYSEGYISSKNGYKGNAQEYTLQLPAGHGQSGSPMLDASGNVLGILTAISNPTEENTYAVSSGALLELLHTLPNESTLRLPRSNKLARMSREQQIAALDKFTFSVKVYKK